MVGNALLSGDPRELLAGWDDDAGRHDTWQPEAAVDLADGRALHELLYADGDLRRPRGWCAPATRVLVEQAAEILEARLDELSRGDTIRVLDYGTGTGLAAIQLLKACRRQGFDERLRGRGVTLELHLVDIPTSWFAQGFQLLGECAWTRFHALTDNNGRFRPLRDVTGGRTMDLVLASMVFHLIPAPALPRAIDALAEITTAGGRLLWNAPDIGPAGPRAVLFHDPNRAVRRCWQALMVGDLEPCSAAVGEAVEIARHQCTDDAVLAAQQRADRRILRRAHTVGEVAGVIRSRYAGEVSTAPHEMITRETLDTLLVPSNQQEYLPEIEDDALRSAVVEELLLDQVLPELRRGSAATPHGLKIQWTFGDFRRAD